MRIITLIRPRSIVEVFLVVAFLSDNHVVYLTH
jgi:hypothetical protein